MATFKQHESNLEAAAEAASWAAEASADRDEKIRWTYAQGGVSIRTIAEAVGLSSARVHQIIHRR